MAVELQLCGRSAEINRTSNQDHNVRTSFLAEQVSCPSLAVKARDTTKELVLGSRDCGAAAVGRLQYAEHRHRSSRLTSDDTAAADGRIADRRTRYIAGIVARWLSVAT